MDERTKILIALERNSHKLYHEVANAMREPDVNKVSRYARLCSKYAKQLKKTPKAPAK